MTRSSLRSRAAVVATLALMCATIGRAQSASLQRDVTLFDSQGRPVAYISGRDGSTIYLWSGQPVAYLQRDPEGGAQVFGFNGAHLGWFVGGYLWRSDGDASCAIREKLRTTEFESPKGSQRPRPFKNLRELSPARPAFTLRFGRVPCERLLLGGR